jgi:2'-5' RNA ligase
MNPPRQKRLFIAVNIPDDIKEKIAEEIEKIKYDFDKKTKFVSKNNWHFTLIFLGYQDETKILSIQKALTEFANIVKETIREPKIVFYKLTYGPIENQTKRMIWLTADLDSSKEFGTMIKILTERLFENGVRWQVDRRPLLYAHLTLARFMPKNARTLPPIEKNINLQFPIKTIELMESHLKRNGPIYEKMISIVLKS